MILEILKKIGPCVSSDLAEEVQKRTSIMPDTIRKQISRAISSGKILKLKNIRFKQNSTFLFLPEHRQTDSFFFNLIRAFEQKNSVYGYFLNALISRGGIIPKCLAPIISGCPICFRDNLSLTGHLNFEGLLENLKINKLISENYVEGLGKCIVLENYPDTMSLTEFKSQLIIEDIFFKAIEDKLKKIGLISFNKAEIRCMKGAKNEFANFIWDFTAPSYIQPLARYVDKEYQQGYIVADVNLFKTITKKHVEYFVKKCEIIRSLKTMPNFIPLFVASFFNDDAFAYGKSKNLIFTTPDNILNDGINNELFELLNCLSKAATVATTNIDKFLDIFCNVNKIEGAALNLKGYLMEFIYAHALKELENGSINMHRTIQSEYKTFEIDIIRTNAEKEIYIYECKGYNSQNKIGKEYLEKWICEIIPAIREYIKNNQEWCNFRQTYEITTTSGFENDALEYLKTKINETKRYTITYKDGKSFYEYIKRIKSRKINEIIKEQYYLI